jgi:hypothetical protein
VGAVGQGAWYNGLVVECPEMISQDVGCKVVNKRGELFLDIDEKGVGGLAVDCSNFHGVGHYFDVGS